MKIIVLHGEDTTKSYARLKQFIDAAKKRSWEISYLDESSANLGDDLSAASLFGAERFFIIRNIKKLGEKETVWLDRNSKKLAGNLIIYHEGTVPRPLIASLPKDAKTEEYKLPKLIWAFLDHIYPGNSKTALKEFHQIIKENPPEFVFSLIAKRLHDLYWIIADPASFAAPSWQASKLKQQAGHYKAGDLEKLIRELAEIDIQAKTGQADTVSSLDLLIAKYLQ